MSDRARSPSPPEPPEEAIEDLLRSDGLLPLPVGLAARVMRGVEGTERPGLLRGLGRLAAAAAVLAAVSLVLTDSAPAFAEALPVEPIAAVLAGAREDAPATATIAEALPSPGRVALPGAALGLLLLAAGPFLAWRWRRRAGPRPGGSS